MSVEKISISVEGSLAASIRASAREAGQPLSTWLARAAEVQLRSGHLRKFLEDWQAENGALTEEELAAAEERLGYRDKKRGAA